MAKIESLPDIHWSPAAALANLLEDADDIGEILILYRLKSNDKLYSQSGNMVNKDVLWMLELEKKRLLENMV